MFYKWTRNNTKEKHIVQETQNMGLLLYLMQMDGEVTSVKYNVSHFLFDKYTHFKYISC